MSLLDRDLILPQLQAKDSEEVIRTLGSLLEGKGYVKDTYVEAVLARERTYPTGLPTKGVCVAIPHADPSHVQGQSAITLATLSHPVRFAMMGDPDTQLDVQVVVMLAIHNPDEHLTLLKSVMKLFSNPELLRGLVAVKTRDEIVTLLAGWNKESQNQSFLEDDLDAHNV